MSCSIAEFYFSNPDLKMTEDLENCAVTIVPALRNTHSITASIQPSPLKNFSSILHCQLSYLTIKNVLRCFDSVVSPLLLTTNCLLKAVDSALLLCSNYNYFIQLYIHNSKLSLSDQTHHSNLHGDSHNLFLVCCWSGKHSNSTAANT